MSTMILGLVSAIATGLLTPLCIWYARRIEWFDRPNARSAHQNPTPRIGGIAIVSVTLGILLFSDATVFHWPADFMVLSLFIIAVMGVIDDYRGLRASIRFVVHLCITTGLIIAIGGLPEMWIGQYLWSWGILGYVIGTVFLVWLINLYNFMDGINGIAASEALSVLGGIALIFFIQGQDIPTLITVLFGAALGFLYWNFPHAKTFLGDSGSGFLGLALGMIALIYAPDSISFWSFLILIGVFMVDATVTLLRRCLAREIVWQAHSQHAYQHAARFYGEHTRVTLSIVAINLLWLWPLAIMASHWRSWGAGLLLISYLPLIMLAIRFKAGLSIKVAQSQEMS